MAVITTYKSSWPKMCWLCHIKPYKQEQQILLSLPAGQIFFHQAPLTMIYSGMYQFIIFSEVICRQTFIQLIKHYTYKMVTNPDNICILAISNVDMFTEVQTDYYDWKVVLT
jgi:hypothetical protein